MLSLLPDWSIVLVVEVEVQRARGREQSQAASSKPFEHRGRSDAHMKDHRLQKADLGEQHSNKGAFEQRVEKGQGCSYWNSGTVFVRVGRWWRQTSWRRISERQGRTRRPEGRHNICEALEAPDFSYRYKCGLCMYLHMRIQVCAPMHTQTEGGRHWMSHFYCYLLWDRVSPWPWDPLSSGSRCWGSRRVQPRPAFIWTHSGLHTCTSSILTHWAIFPATALVFAHNWMRNHQRSSGEWWVW